MRMMCSTFIVLVLFMGIIADTDYSKSYAKHQLWRLRVSNDEQISKIAAFKRIAHLHDIDFWTEHFSIHTPVSSDSTAFSDIHGSIKSKLIFFSRLK